MKPTKRRPNLKMQQTTAGTLKGAGEMLVDCGSVALDLPADGDEMRFNVNAGKGYITFKADRVDSTEWWLYAEAVGEFLYNEDGKETGHAPLDMPEKLGEKIIVTL